MKANFDDGAAPEGQPAEFDVVALDPDGKQIERQGRRLDAEEPHPRLPVVQFRRRVALRGDHCARAKIDDGKLDIGAAAPARLSRSRSTGASTASRSRAEDAAPVSIDFSSGYYYGDAAKAETPDTLEARASTGPTSKPGDTVNVKIDRAQAGKATVAGHGRPPADGDSASMFRRAAPRYRSRSAATGAPAPMCWPRCYRPMDVAAKRMPARAMGVAWFGIDRAERTLDVTPDDARGDEAAPAPAACRSSSAISRAGEEAFITVAAVDVGILNLTRYDPPAPENYYFDQQRLAAELRDIYGLLIDGMQGERGRHPLRRRRRRRPSTRRPPTQEPLALLSPASSRSAPDGTADGRLRHPGLQRHGARDGRGVDARPRSAMPRRT